MLRDMGFLKFLQKYDIVPFIHGTYWMGMFDVSDDADFLKLL